ADGSDRGQHGEGRRVAARHVGEHGSGPRSERRGEQDGEAEDAGEVAVGVRAPAIRDRRRLQQRGDPRPTPASIEAATSSPAGPGTTASASVLAETSTNTTAVRAVRDGTALGQLVGGPAPERLATRTA